MMIGIKTVDACFNVDAVVRCIGVRGVGSSTMLAV